ncbi:uncharacterized protein LOC118506773 [Anopheles stephensi]|uniref:uncharacterized protein LOC118506773 n=1 Tax=Anopheles stephensi TaxID=30069 RepID=UPI0016588608|nr:uncharacterized protein LOC118506773 [Anopheles stephensi]
MLRKKFLLHRDGSTVDESHKMAAIRCVFSKQCIRRCGNCCEFVTFGGVPSLQHHHHHRGSVVGRGLCMQICVLPERKENHQLSSIRMTGPPLDAGTSSPGRIRYWILFDHT